MIQKQNMILFVLITLSEGRFLQAKKSLNQQLQKLLSSSSSCSKISKKQKRFLLTKSTSIKTDEKFIKNKNGTFAQYPKDEGGGNVPYYTGEIMLSPSQNGTYPSKLAPFQSINSNLVSKTSNFGKKGSELVLTYNDSTGLITISGNNITSITGTLDCCGPQQGAIINVGGKNDLAVFTWELDGRFNNNSSALSVFITSSQ